MSLKPTLVAREEAEIAADGSSRCSLPAVIQSVGQFLTNRPPTLSRLNSQVPRAAVTPAQQHLDDFVLVPRTPVFASLPFASYSRSGDIPFSNHTPFLSAAQPASQVPMSDLAIDCIIYPA